MRGRLAAKLIKARLPWQRPQAVVVNPSSPEAGETLIPQNNCENNDIKCSSNSLPNDLYNIWSFTNEESCYIHVHEKAEMHLYVQI